MRILKSVLNVNFGIIFFCFFYKGLLPGLYCQHDTILIKSCINQMFTGMSSFDSSLVHQTFANGFILKSIVTSKTGETHLKEESGENFLKIIGTKKPGLKYDERLLSFTIMIDGDMAIVWTPYHFYLNDIFSHCGVNAFTLIKLHGTWKILSITDTRRNSDC